MEGYLKIKTKIDNKDVDKGITELENKIKKLQTDNSNASIEQSSLQEEINQYENLCAEAEKYKKKIEQLQVEKEKLKNTSNIPLTDNVQYNDIQSQISKIKEQYIPLLKKIDKMSNKKMSNKESKHYELLKQKAEEYQNKMHSLIKTREQLTSNLTNKGSEYSNINMQIEQMKQKYAQATAEIGKQAPKIDKVQQKLNKVKVKQSENNAKIQEFKDKIESIKINKAEGQISKIGNSLQSIITKIGRMTLAVFGVRTAWNAVRSAVNLVKQYNPQISADFQYMGYCISKMLAPAVQWLTKLLYTLLSYINAISKAWFGINLFSGASVKNFKKMQSSAGGTAKSAKEIQKSLQGFDEMNVLSDTSNTSSGSGVSTPSMDLSNMQGENPKWLQWIIDHKDEIISTLATIALVIGAIKLGNFIGEIINVSDGLFKVVNWLGTLGTKLLEIFKTLGLMKSIGIAVLITGIILLIKDVIAMITDPSWENFGKILTDIGIILAGISLIMGNWIVAIVALVAIIAGLCVQLFAQEGAIMSVEDAEKNLEKATQNLEEANNSYIDSVDKAESANKRLEEAEKKCGITGEELFKQVQQGTLDYKDMTDEQKEVYKAYLNNETAQKELREATDKLTEAKKQEKIASWENKLATMAEAGQYDEYKKAVVDAFNNGELSAEEARDLIGKSMSGMSRDSQKTFMEDLPGDIKNGLDPKKYETTGQKIKKWFSGVGEDLVEGAKTIGKNIANAIISKIESMINKVVSGINFLIKGMNKISFKVPDWLGGGTIGLNIGLVPKVSLPRLAKGGVISQPTQAVIGEAGREAVVPLENNMEWLDILADKLASKIGASGGSYIIQLDSRAIQRGLAKRQQELAFARNGR